MSPRPLGENGEMLVVLIWYLYVGTGSLCPASSLASRERTRDLGSAGWRAVLRLMVSGVAPEEEEEEDDDDDDVLSPSLSLVCVGVTGAVVGSGWRRWLVVERLLTSSGYCCC